MRGARPVGGAAGRAPALLAQLADADIAEAMNAEPAKTLGADHADSWPDWPAFGLTDDMRGALARARGRGEVAVLATLVAVEGSGPSRLGAQMCFAEGEVAGFVSGGCVEADLAQWARRVAAERAPRLVAYGRGSPFQDIRLACGGRIEVFLERLEPDDGAVADLIELSAARRPGLWRSDGIRRACIDAAGAPAQGAEEAGLERAPLSIWRRFDPQPRLFVVGGDPTAMAIAALGSTVGLQTVLVRPKGPAEPPPLAGVAYHAGELVDAFADFAPDAWSYVAVATHDLESDEAALVAALRTEAGYVGVLGARRRIPERMARLAAAGLAPEALARLKAPIGLPLGGKAPWEIAVAVLAEIIGARRARDE